MTRTIRVSNKSTQTSPSLHQHHQTPEVFKDDQQQSNNLPRSSRSVILSDKSPVNFNLTTSDIDESTPSQPEHTVNLSLKKRLTFEDETPEQADDRNKSRMEHTPSSVSIQTPKETSKRKTPNSTTSQSEMKKPRGRPKSTPSEMTSSKPETEKNTRGRSHSIDVQSKIEIELGKKRRSKSSVSKVSVHEEPVEETTSNVSVHKTPEKKRGRPKKAASATVPKEDKQNGKQIHSEPTRKSNRILSKNSETPVTAKRALEDEDHHPVVVSTPRRSPSTKRHRIHKKRESISKNIDLLDTKLEEYYNPSKDVRRSFRIREYMIQKLEAQKEHFMHLLRLLEEKDDMLKRIVKKKDTDSEKSIRRIPGPRKLIIVSDDDTDDDLNN